MKIKISNTDKWKYFYIKDMFDVLLAKGDLKENKCEYGKYPLISSGSENNGIVAFTSGKSIDNNKHDSELFSGNCITLDMFGQAFYQNIDFFAVSHGRVNILQPKKYLKLNKYHLLFICTLINRERFKYSYGRAIYSNGAKNIKIKLPVDDQGNQDWQFMENYIKSFNIKIPKSKNNKSNKPVNISNWQVFQIKDIFNIETGSDLIYREQEHGELPVVGHKANNHGITCTIEKIDDRKLYNHTKTISLGDRGAFTAYVQHQDFYIGTRVKALISKSSKANMYNLLFIATIINLESFKYNYGRNATDKIPKILIKLPAILNDDGTYEPDYQYMEDYIKSLRYGDVIT